MLPTHPRHLAGVLLVFAANLAPVSASPLEDAIGAAVFTGPTHPHATAIFQNPGALGLSASGKHFYLGGDLRLSQVSIDRRFLDPETGELSPGPSSDSTTLSPGGLAAFYASVGDRAHVGVALHTPYFERFIEREEPLRFHTRGGHLFQGVGSIAFAYKASRKFFFGLGLSIGYSSLRLRFARDTALEAGSGTERGIRSDCGGAPCGLENPEATQYYDVQVRTDGVAGLFQTKNLALSGGFVWTPRDGWWLGASYASAAGSLASLDLGGDAEVLEAPRDGGERLRGDAEVTYRMPQAVQAGVRGQILPGYEIVGGARWQSLSRHDQLDIRFFGGDLSSGEVPDWYPRHRGLDNTWRVHAGIERQRGPRLRFGGRLRFETGAVGEDAVTPLGVYGPNLALASGVELRVTQDTIVTAGYDLSWYPELNSTDSVFDPRDRLACVDSGFDFDRCEAARQGRATPTPAGTYSRFEHAFTLSIRYHRL